MRCKCEGFFQGLMSLDRAGRAKVYPAQGRTPPKGRGHDKTVPALIADSRYRFETVCFPNRPEDRLPCGYDGQRADKAYFDAFQGAAAQGKNGVAIVLRVCRIDGPGKSVVGHLGYLGQLDLI